MQLTELFKSIDRLQAVYGNPGLRSIYGAGNLKSPRFMFIFMNPTRRNVSADPNWTGIRAPWLGTKNIWEMFWQIGAISRSTLEKIRVSKPRDWSIPFARDIYEEIARNKIYITNLAKCTQVDARPLSNDVFRQYLEIMKSEIRLINPKWIITLGNQVSSILLDRSITVSGYQGRQKEVLQIPERSFDVYPVYYPVGQGRRNLPKAIERIQAISGVK